jgi:hypothetical protein
MTNPVEDGSINYVVKVRKTHPTKGVQEISFLAERVEENVVNTVTKINYATVNAFKQDSQPPTKKTIDLKKIDWLFHIKGLLGPQNAIVDGTTQWVTATQAKNVLLHKILFSQNKTVASAIKLYWRGISSDNASANSNLNDLMDNDIDSRNATASFDKMTIGDHVIRAEKNYSTSTYAALDSDESNAFFYTLEITFTRAIPI